MEFIFASFFSSLYLLRQQISIFLPPLIMEDEQCMVDKYEFVCFFILALNFPFFP